MRFDVCCVLSRFFQLSERRRTQFSEGIHKVPDLGGKFRSFSRRNPFGAKPLLLYSTESQQLLQKLHSLFGRIITVQVMAVSEVSPTDVDTVYALLKRPQDMVRGYARGTHHSDDPDIRRVLHTTDPSQVSSGVCSPGTEKTQYLGFKPAFTHIKPFLARSIPDRIISIP